MILNYLGKNVRAKDIIEVFNNVKERESLLKYYEDQLNADSIQPEQKENLQKMIKTLQNLMQNDLSLDELTNDKPITLSRELITTISKEELVDLIKTILNYIPNKQVSIENYYTNTVLKNDAYGFNKYSHVSAIFDEEETAKLIENYNAVLEETGLDLHFDLGGFTVSQAVEASRKVTDIANHINSLKVDGNPLSPLEKFLYAYDIITSTTYNESDNTNPAESRHIFGILNGDKCVCLGYGEHATELFNRIGIKTTCQHVNINGNKLNNIEAVPNHANCTIRLKDDKYGIDGIFYSDPCWDSPLVDKQLGVTTYGNGYAHALLSYSDLHKLYPNIVLPNKMEKTLRDDFNNKCFLVYDDVDEEIRESYEYKKAQLEEHEHKLVEKLTNALKDENTLYPAIINGIINTYNKSNTDIGKQKYKLSRLEKSLLTTNICLEIFTSLALYDSDKSSMDEIFAIDKDSLNYDDFKNFIVDRLQSNDPTITQVVKKRTEGAKLNSIAPIPIQKLISSGMSLEDIVKSVGKTFNKMTREYTPQELLFNDFHTGYVNPLFTNMNIAEPLWLEFEEKMDKPTQIPFETLEKAILVAGKAKSPHLNAESVEDKKLLVDDSYKFLFDKLINTKNRIKYAMYDSDYNIQKQTLFKYMNIDNAFYKYTKEEVLKSIAQKAEKPIPKKLDDVSGEP